MEKLFRVILEMGITAVPVILAVFAIRMCLLRAPKRWIPSGSSVFCFIGAQHI